MAGGEGSEMVDHILFSVQASGTTRVLPDILRKQFLTPHLGYIQTRCISD